MQFVVDSDHAGLGHGRMLTEGAFDLQGSNVRAVVDDHLFLAAVEPDVPILIRVGQVAGVQPPVAHNFAGRVGIAPITCHQAPGLDPELAHFSSG